MPFPSSFSFIHCISRYRCHHGYRAITFVASVSPKPSICKNKFYYIALAYSTYVHTHTLLYSPSSLHPFQSYLWNSIGIVSSCFICLPALDSVKLLGWVWTTSTVRFMQYWVTSRWSQTHNPHLIVGNTLWKWPAILWMPNLPWRGSPSSRRFRARWHVVFIRR